MPEVHVPRLEEDEAEPPVSVPAPPGHRPRRSGLLKAALEVALIGVGVFLGLAGEQWRQSREQHEQAHAALRRFQAEIETNRSAVAAVTGYHATVLKSMSAYLSADETARKKLEVPLEGLRPAMFEHTAWDLALATQSLAHIDSELAFTLARVYNVQQNYTELTRGIVQTMYSHPPGERSSDPDLFLRAAAIY